MGENNKNEVCPKCGSKNVIVPSIMDEQKDSVGNVAWTNICLGPIGGFLCRLCTTSTKRVVNKKTCKVCQDCGEKFK